MVHLSALHLELKVQVAFIYHPSYQFTVGIPSRDPTSFHWLPIASYLTFSFSCSNPAREPFQKNDWVYVGCRRLTVWVVRFTAFPVLPLSISGMLEPKYQNKTSKLSNKISLKPKGLTAPVALALVYSQNLEKSVFHFPLMQLKSHQHGRSWEHAVSPRPGTWHQPRWQERCERDCSCAVLITLGRG